MNETSLSRLPSLREAGSRSEAEGSSAEAEISTEESATSGFRVNLEVYSGPFDALLGMIANNRLELTEVSSPRYRGIPDITCAGSISQKTWMRPAPFSISPLFWSRPKAWRFCPRRRQPARRAEPRSARERDLLFARLLQYRAYKQAAGDFRARIAANSGDSRTRRPWTRALPPCCLSWYGR